MLFKLRFALWDVLSARRMASDIYFTFVGYIPLVIIVDYVGKDLPDGCFRNAFVEVNADMSHEGRGKSDEYPDGITFRGPEICYTGREQDKNTKAHEDVLGPILTTSLRYSRLLSQCMISVY